MDGWWKDGVWGRTPGGTPGSPVLLEGRPCGQQLRTRIRWQRGELWLEPGIRTPGRQSQLGRHLAVCLETICFTLLAACLSNECSLETSLESCDSLKSFAPKASEMRSFHTRIMTPLDSLSAHSLLRLPLLGLTWNCLCLIFLQNLQWLPTACHIQHTFLPLTFKRYTVCPLPPNPNVSQHAASGTSHSGQAAFLPDSDSPPGLCFYALPVSFLTSKS